jgi:hypothetical protein
MLFKNSARTSKRTPNFTINFLTLFKEIIAVYIENHVKPINTKCSITDCQSRWFIQLPLALKGLMTNCSLVLEEDLRLMRISGWRRKARRRDEWKSVLREVKVPQGP